jgi:hypothetical protein
MIRRAAFLLALACCAAPAGQRDPWVRIASANLELFTTGGERSGVDLLKHFEQVRSFFTQAFGSRLVAGKPVRLIAFHSEKEYRLYRPNELATAFYQPGTEHDFIVMENGAPDHYDVAVHEFTHLMIHQSNLAVPVWLNEGMAELYSNLAPMGSKIVVGNVIAGRAQTLLARNGLTWGAWWPSITTRRFIPKGRRRACSMPKVGRWSTCSISTPPTGRR